MRHDQHNRGPGRCLRRRIEPVGDADIGPRCRHAGRDGIALVVGHLRVAPHRDPRPPGRRVPREGCSQPGEQPVRCCGVGRADRLRERRERGIRDASLELADHAQHPLLGFGEHRHRLSAELQDGVGPPHRRVGGVEAQHVPILPRAVARESSSTGGAGEPVSAAAWGGGETACSDRAVIVRCAVAVVAGVVVVAVGQTAGQQPRKGIVQLVRSGLLAAGACL